MKNIPPAGYLCESTGLRLWRSREAAFHYHRAEGWLTGIVSCPHCGHFQDAFVHPFADLENLPCRSCGFANACLKSEPCPPHA